MINPESFPQLREAYHLIKDGDSNSALPIITQTLKDDKQNIDAWWLAAFAAESTHKKVLALQQVLRLDHTHRPARQMLQTLTSSPRKKTASAQPKPVRWFFVLTSTFGLLALAFGMLAFFDNLTGCNLVCPLYNTIFGEPDALGWVHITRGGEVDDDIDRDDRIPITRDERIAYSSLQTETLEKDTAHRYSFYARRGDQIVVAMTCTNNGDPDIKTLELWDSQGNMVTTEVNEIPFAPPIPGQEARFLLYEDVIRDDSYSVVIVSRPGGPSGTYTLIVTTVGHALDDY